LIEAAKRHLLVTFCSYSPYKTALT